MFQFHCEITKITRHTQIFMLTTHFLTLYVYCNAIKKQGCPWSGATLYCVVLYVIVVTLQSGRLSCT